MLINVLRGGTQEKVIHIEHYPNSQLSKVGDNRAQSLAKEKGADTKSKRKDSPTVSYALPTDPEITLGL